jgi:prevent-host-death family protein
MRNIIPITDLQQKTRKYVQMVRETGKPIVITQRGRPAAVLASADDFEGYLVTLDEMSYPDSQERLARAKRDLDAGRGITLAAFLSKKQKQKPKRRG